MGIWTSAREKKEHILYVVLTVVLLESVRIKYNKIESDGRRNNLSSSEINKRQKIFFFLVSLLYALIFLLPTSNYVSDSIQKLFSNTEARFFESVWFPSIVLIISETILTTIIFILLKLYVEKVNKALKFFKKIGRSIQDGAKISKKIIDKGKGPMNSLKGLLKKRKAKKETKLHKIQKRE